MNEIQRLNAIRRRSSVDRRAWLAASGNRSRKGRFEVTRLTSNHAARETLVGLLPGEVVEVAIVHERVCRLVER